MQVSEELSPLWRNRIEQDHSRILSRSEEGLPLKEEPPKQEFQISPASEANKNMCRCFDVSAFIFDRAGVAGLIAQSANTP